MKLDFPGETPEYRAARERLLEQEIELRRQMETVAKARRALPPGALLREDYRFDAIGADGKPVEVKLSQLFGNQRASLIVYNMMFPRHRSDDRPKAECGPTAGLPREQGPCPSCVAFLDQLDGTARHLEQTVAFVAVAKAPIDRVKAFADDRGWRHLRLVSSARNRFKNDYGAEDADGQQQPMCNVFQKTPEGIRHFWSSEMLYAPVDPGQDPRHMGTVEPLWTMMDLTREGRHEWTEQLQYACCH